MKWLGTLLLAFAAFISLARPAYAQTLDVNVTVVGHTGVVAGAPSDHFLGFSGPVEIPGVALGPGTYIFRSVAPSVIQVLNEDRSMVYGMFFVTPTWRGEVTSDYAVTLQRIRDDAPPRIATVFPPDASGGYELWYPTAEIDAVEQVAMR
jgi:hypothetical protein